MKEEFETVKKLPFIKSFFLSDDGQFPNSAYPVLLYKEILDLNTLRPAAKIEALFAKNDWSNFWRNGIFDYLHYHSITHEVMGMYSGKTTVLLGGTKGLELEFEKGDVLILPAGIAHRNLRPENKIKCVGAYPAGRGYDIQYGKRGERPQTDLNIKRAIFPLQDPVFGKQNGIPLCWKYQNR
jgi:uncharacterized protein YjlB